MGGETGSWRAVGEGGQRAESKESTIFRLWNVDSFGGLVFRGGEAPVIRGSLCFVSGEMFCLFCHLWGHTNRELQKYCWLAKTQAATNLFMFSITAATLGLQTKALHGLTWYSGLQRQTSVVLADALMVLRWDLHQGTQLTAPVSATQTHRLQAHEILGPPTEVRSMQSEYLGWIVTISIAQNTVLGKIITTVPYATTKRSCRML